MALFNGFTFDGVNSLDYGIYITGEGVYNAPERAVEMVEIQGRNGALAIDQGRWDNIEVTYHCGCFGADQADFAERIGRFRNAICSRTSYCRLTDDYHPDEYRLALYHAGVEVDHVRRAGEFDLIFDCKPQRFLTSGEDTITVGDWGDVTEYSGDVVSFEGDEMTAVKSLSISLSPVQNLNGYDHPWVGGAGKNKYPILIGADRFNTNNSGTYTNNNGVLEITPKVDTSAANSGVYPASNSQIARLIQSIIDGGGTPTISFDAKASVLPARLRYKTTSESLYADLTQTWQRFSFSVTSTTSIIFYGSYIAQSTVISISNLMISTDGTTAYEPYENICPISGWDGVSVTRAGKNLLENIAPSSSTVRGVVCTKNSDGSVTLNGTVTGGTMYLTLSGGFYATKAAMPKNLIGKTITISGAQTAVNILLAQYAEDGTATNMATSSSRIVTIRDDCRYYGVFIMATSGTYINNITVYPQIELGTTVTAYEPYQGETITQEFVDAQGNTLTVYGGDSEIVGGVLTVTHLLFTENGQAGWGRNNNGSFYKYYTPMPISVQDAEGCACNYAPYAINFNGWNVFARANGLISLGTSWGDIFPDVASLQAQFAQTPLQVVYKLATPITYTLTPQQVETLIGTNNVWSDAGEVTVEIADDPNKIVNPTLYDAKPLIKVSGYGTVQVGSVTITIEGSASDVTYIDCDSMECYRLNGLAIVSANSAVSFSSYDFPVLEADAITGITYSTNISQVQIAPRWWQL